MSAFNARLSPKEILGLPALSVMAAVILLASGMFSLLAPVMILKLLSALIALCSLITLIFALALGDKLVFLPVILCAYFEAKTKNLIGEEE